MNTLFKLIATYELVVEFSTLERPVRIEIFKPLEDKFLYRARVWMQNTYNLYPAYLNTDKNGEDLNTIHSSDQLDMDMTSLITDDPEIITGKHYMNKSDFLDYLKSSINYFKERFVN